MQAQFSQPTFPERISAISSDETLATAYDYVLPSELIAQSPAARRDASRLFVLRENGAEHRSFDELPLLLRAGDLLVLNETRVIAARLFGRRERGDAHVELLLLHPAQRLRYDDTARRWIALARPARRLRAGDRIHFEGGASAEVTCVLDEGMRELSFTIPDSFEHFLERVGRMPLPPYIHNGSAEAAQRYQTVFARVPGSVAAPTASLHFTQELLDALRQSGIEIARLTLDVGVGTFRPIAADRLDEHAMHAEAYALSPEAATQIQRAQRDGRRIVAAGTTVVRALEGNAAEFGEIRSGEFATDLFVRPGFQFAVVDALITNFHLPRSTLLVLVSAFAGRERMLAAYCEAVERKYRFYSFGDAMLIERMACAT
jgi:S-adenosylmethionine:tRNA ribosyltransferase-isomerase